MKRSLLLCFLTFSACLLRSQDVPLIKKPGAGTPANTDTVEAMAVIDIGWDFIYSGQYDSALHYLSRGLDLSKRLSFRRGMLAYYHGRAHIYSYQGNNVKALQIYNLLLSEARANKHKQGMYKSYAAIGLVQRNLGKFPEAMEATLQSLRYARELGKKKQIASAYSNIGLILSDQNKPEKAIPYYEKAISVFVETGDSMNLCFQYNDLGAIYQDLRQGEKARKTLYLSLQCGQAMGNMSAVASAHTNLGAYFLTAALPDSALWHLQKAIGLWEKQGDVEGLIPCIVNVGYIYSKKGNAGKSLVYVEEANKMAYAVHSLHFVAETEKILSEVHRDSHDFQKAYEHYRKYITARDSMFNEENAAKLVKSEMNYEFEKKQILAQQEQLKKDTEAEATRRKQQVIIWVVSGSLLLLSVIAFLVIRQFRFKNREREMQLEQKLLRSQMNPHFIFNSLQAIQNFILKRNEKDAVRYLGSFASITRSVLENSRMEMIPLRKEVGLLGNYLQLQKLRFGEKFEYEVLVDEVISQDEVYIPPMLSQPFIENALEHGMNGIEAGGLIRVHFSMQGQALVLEIMDNGYGMDASKKQEKDHTSLAMTITRERIELMNRKSDAKITFTVSDAYPGTERVGVKVRFIIPLSGISI